MVFQLPSVKVLMVSHSDSESLIYKLKNSEILSRVEGRFPQKLTVRHCVTLKNQVSNALR